MVRFACIIPLLSFFLGVESLTLSAGDVCNLVTFIPFSDLRHGPRNAHADALGTYGYGSWPNASSLAKASLTLMAAAEMAREHFNQRDGALVPELEELRSCPIRLESTYMDSAYDRRTTTSSLLEYARNSSVCAVVGPANDFVAQGLSAITEALQTPQISYASNGYRLSKQAEYPMVARALPVAYDFGKAVTMFFNRDVLKREVAGIIYEETDYGEQFESPLEEFEDDLGYLTITEGFSSGDDDSIRSALQEAKDKGFRTIVVITDQVALLDDVASIADAMGMLGPGYLYIISGGALPPALLAEKVQYEVDSPADKMLRGAALFTNYDRFVYYGDEDPFMVEWKRQGRALARKIGRIGINGEIDELLGDLSQDFFETETPSEYASYIYDAVIAAGISACSAWSTRQDSVGNATRYHMAHLLQTEFTGAAGPFRFKDSEDTNGQPVKENFRDPKGSVFGMYNLRPKDTGDDGLQRYQPILTHLYGYENQEHGEWAPVTNTEFLFFDGTANEPMPRRETANAHFISTAVFSSGIVMSVTASIISIGTGVLVFLSRGHRLIKASQPEFLLMLCFGATLVASSSIFVSFDEARGLSATRLTHMCASLPWFFVLGYLTMYCALFSKLWRISQVLQMRRRRAIGIKNVLFPFAALSGCCVITLLVWQIVDPLVWNRKVISEGEAPYETYGECGSEKFGFLPFVLPLGLFFFVAVGLTVGIAWKMRDVQAELSESRWIFAGIYVHIQTWFVGIPLLYITSGVSKDAFYLMSVVLAFTFSSSQVCLVIWPKMFTILSERFGFVSYAPNPKISIRGGGTSFVSGLTQSSSRKGMKVCDDPIEEGILSPDI